MADEVVHHPVDKSTEAETTDRGLFDFLGSKKDENKPAAAAADYQQQEAIATEFEQKVHVSEPAPKFEECKVEEEEKKPSLLDKLHRSGSSSSSSVSI